MATRNIFTRVVEITSKPGKAVELCRIIDEKILPILRGQQGFVDEMVLVSGTDPDGILAISQWDTKEDAKRYESEQFGKVQNLLQNLLASPPQVRIFNVHTSTVHGITARKAA